MGDCTFNGDCNFLGDFLGELSTSLFREDEAFLGDWVAFLVGEANLVSHKSSLRRGDIITGGSEIVFTLDGVFRRLLEGLSLSVDETCLQVS